MMNWKDLFHAHIAILDERLSKICNELGIDSLVLGSGSSRYYFEDDQDVPFRSNHHFAHLCPHPGVGHLLQIQPGTTPKLLVHSPDDFWHEHKVLLPDYWTDAFDIQTIGEVDEGWRHLKKHGRTVYHGPDVQQAEAVGLDIDTQDLLPRMNWSRSFKTEYEIACVTESTKLAANAHEAAEACFLSGGSELDIHLAYLQALRALDRQLPYESIVCLNEKGAILHYNEKRDNVRDAMTLLIDSGANYQGYACDITRSYASSKAPQVFRELLSSTRSIQIELTKMVKIGNSMADVHFESHRKVGEVLLKHGIIKNLTVEEAVKGGLTTTFYPHGIGHMLGLLVHDVAGQQIDETGRMGEPDHRFPKLRSTRQLEPGHLLTIEPGIYFIDSLLQKQQVGEFKSHFDWSLIESLKPCGGIRIEDNVLVTSSEPRNITREFLGDGKI